MIFGVAGNMISVLQCIAEKRAMVNVERFLKTNDVGVGIFKVLHDAGDPFLSVLDEPKRQIPNIEGDRFYAHVILW